MYNHSCCWLPLLRRRPNQLATLRELESKVNLGRVSTAVSCFFKHQQPRMYIYSGLSTLLRSLSGVSANEWQLQVLASMASSTKHDADGVNVHLGTQSAASMRIWQ
jgi:hypothetical protein